MLKRFRIYGTDDDNYGEAILLKNELYLNYLMEMPQPGEELSPVRNENIDTQCLQVKLSLLNNVSKLEQELITIHGSFIKVRPWISRIKVWSTCCL